MPGETDNQGTVSNHVEETESEPRAQQETQENPGTAIDLGISGSPEEITEHRGESARSE